MQPVVMGMILQYLSRLRDGTGRVQAEGVSSAEQAAETPDTEAATPDVFAVRARTLLANGSVNAAGLVLLAPRGAADAKWDAAVADAAGFARALGLSGALIGRPVEGAVGVMTTGLPEEDVRRLAEALQASLSQAMEGASDRRPAPVIVDSGVAYAETGGTLEGLLAVASKQLELAAHSGQAPETDGRSGEAPVASRPDEQFRPVPHGLEAGARDGLLPGQLPGFMLPGGRPGDCGQVQPWSRANQTIILPAVRAEQNIPEDWAALLRDFNESMARGEVAMYYQPKFQAESYDVAGAEALIRWRHPERGFVPPDKFIPIIEAAGDCRAMTEWVLQTVLKAQAELAAMAFPLEVSVNVPAMLISDRAFAKSALEIASRRPAPLRFEITETGVFGDPEGALENLYRFAEAGIRIAIDDYGVGMSSLTYLKRLPAHELKIDKSFVSGMTQSHRDPIIVRSTIDLAHGLAMTATAEGVELPTELALLRVMGCDHIQGYLMAKPMPLDQLKLFLADKDRMAHLPREVTALARAESAWAEKVQAAFR